MTTPDRLEKYPAHASIEEDAKYSFEDTARLWAEFQSALDEIDLKDAELVHLRKELKRASQNIVSMAQDLGQALSANQGEEKKPFQAWHYPSADKEQK